MRNTATLPMPAATAAGHLFSPLGDSRERAVRCHCGRLTWNWCAACDAHCDHGPASRRESRPNRLGVKWLGAAALAMLAVLGVNVAQPTGAQAATYPLGQPVKVVLSGPSATLTAQVVATAPTTANGRGRWIAVSAPLAGRQQRVGTFAAPGTTVPVKVTLPARSFVLGRSQWMTRDLGDGQLSPMAVDARQASAFAGVFVGASWPGTVAVLAQVRHYSTARGTFVPSQASPVQVQALAGSGWVTVATLTTDAYGWVGSNVPAMPGADVYRLVRPDGAQAWGVQSPPIVITAPTPFDI